MLHKIPSLFPWKHNKTKIMAEAVLEQEVQLGDLAPCGICGRTFLPGPLLKHTKICEKNSMKKRKIFNSLRQRVEGTDLALFHQKTYLKKKEEPPPSKPPETKSQVWKEKHQQLVNAIRAAKGSSQNVVTAVRQQRSQNSINPGCERCPTCERQFGPKAFDRHVEWCKEKQARLPQPIAGIQQAKERLEARIKYRVPPLSKSKKTVKEKYQSPIKHEIPTVKSTGCLDKKSSSKKSQPVKKHEKSPEPSPSSANRTVKSPEIKSRRSESIKSSGRGTSKINATHINETTTGITVSHLHNTPLVPPKRLITWRDVKSEESEIKRTPRNPPEKINAKIKPVRSDSTILTRKNLSHIPVGVKKECEIKGVHPKLPKCTPKRGSDITETEESTSPRSDICSARRPGVNMVYQSRLPDKLPRFLGPKKSPDNTETEESISPTSENISHPATHSKTINKTNSHPLSATRYNRTPIKKPIPKTIFPKRSPEVTAREKPNSPTSNTINKISHYSDSNIPYCDTKKDKIIVVKPEVKPDKPVNVLKEMGQYVYSLDSKESTKILKTCSKEKSDVSLEVNGNQYNVLKLDSSNQHLISENVLLLTQGQESATSEGQKILKQILILVPQPSCTKIDDDVASDEKAPFYNVSEHSEMKDMSDSTLPNMIYENADLEFSECADLNISSDYPDDFKSRDVEKIESAKDILIKVDSSSHTIELGNGILDRFQNFCSDYGIPIENQVVQNISKDDEDVVEVKKFKGYGCQNEEDFKSKETENIPLTGADFSSDDSINENEYKNEDLNRKNDEVVTLVEHYQNDCDEDYSHEEDEDEQSFSEENEDFEYREDDGIGSEELYTEHDVAELSTSDEAEFELLEEDTQGISKKQRRKKLKKHHHPPFTWHGAEESFSLSTVEECSTEKDFAEKKSITNNVDTDLSRTTLIDNDLGSIDNSKNLNSNTVKLANSKSKLNCEDENNDETVCEARLEENCSLGKVDESQSKKLSNENMMNEATNNVIDIVKSERNDETLCDDILTNNEPGTNDDEENEDESSVLNFSFEKLNSDTIDAILYQNLAATSDMESMQGLCSNPHSAALSKARLEREVRNCCSDVHLPHNNDCLNFPAYSETDLSKFVRLQCIMQANNADDSKYFEVIETDKLLEIAGEEFLSSLNVQNDAKYDTSRMETSQLVTIDLNQRDTSSDFGNVTNINDSIVEKDKYFNESRPTTPTKPTRNILVRSKKSENLKLPQNSISCSLMDAGENTDEISKNAHKAFEVQAIDERNVKHKSKMEYERSINLEGIKNENQPLSSNSSAQDMYSPKFLNLVDTIITKSDDVENSGALLKISVKDCKRLINLNPKQLSSIQMKRFKFPAIAKRKSTKETIKKSESITLPVIAGAQSKLNKNHETSSLAKIIFKRGHHSADDLNGARNREEPYNPILTAERQLMELLECDDFKPLKSTQVSTKEIHNQKVTNQPDKNNLKNKRASTIDPPSEFKDETDIFDENFELIENFINDNLNDEDILSKLDEISTMSVCSERSITPQNQMIESNYMHLDELSIDPRLINEYDNLSIPEHLNVDDCSPNCSFPQINNKFFKLSKLSNLEPIALFKSDKNDSELNNFVLSLGNTKITEQKNSKVIKNSQKTPCSAGRASSPANKKKNILALKRSVPSFSTKPQSAISRMETENNYYNEQDEYTKQEGYSPPPADDLFSIDDNMYEEYKKYEQLYLLEKEEKMREEQRKQHTDEENYIAKMSGDSAYGSLSRNKPKIRARVAKLSPLEHRTGSASSSGSEVCILPKHNDNITEDNLNKLSKYCHECGNKHPLTTAKFCVECGVRRLVL